MCEEAHSKSVVFMMFECLISASLFHLDGIGIREGLQDRVADWQPDI